MAVLGLVLQRLIPASCQRDNRLLLFLSTYLPVIYPSAEIHSQLSTKILIIGFEVVQAMLTASGYSCQFLSNLSSISTLSCLVASIHSLSTVLQPRDVCGPSSNGPLTEAFLSTVVSLSQCDLSTSCCQRKIVTDGLLPRPALYHHLSLRLLIFNV